MNSISKTPISASTKFLLVLFLVFSAVRLVDYMFYGQDFRNLIAAIGFALMAYGIFKDGLGKNTTHLKGRYASFIGAILVFGSLAMRYLA